MNFKVGKQFVVKSFFFEPYIGIGMAYREIKHIQKSSSRDSFIFDGALYNEGKRIQLNIPVNFKLGYRF